MSYTTCRKRNRRRKRLRRRWGRNRKKLEGDGKGNVGGIEKKKRVDEKMENGR
jgi:hypothetical protein